MTTEEVEGYEGTLEQAVEDGLLEVAPHPLGWTHWIKWRSAEGRRPKGRSLKQEAALWRAFSEEFYGADWQERIQVPSGEEAPGATAAAGHGAAAAADRASEEDDGEEMEECPFDAEFEDEFIPPQPEGGLTSEALALQQEQEASSSSKGSQRPMRGKYSATRWMQAASRGATPPASQRAAGQLSLKKSSGGA